MLRYDWLSAIWGAGLSRGSLPLNRPPAEPFCPYKHPRASAVDTRARGHFGTFPSCRNDFARIRVLPERRRITIKPTNERVSLARFMFYFRLKIIAALLCRTKETTRKMHHRKSQTGFDWSETRSHPRTFAAQIKKFIWKLLFVFTTFFSTSGIAHVLSNQQICCQHIKTHFPNPL